MSEEKKDETIDDQIATFRRMIDAIAKDTGAEIDADCRFEFKWTIHWKHDDVTNTVWYGVASRVSHNKLLDVTVYRGANWVVVPHRFWWEDDTIVYVFRPRCEDNTLVSIDEYKMRKKQIESQKT
jgi:hypothetical protein